MERSTQRMGIRVAWDGEAVGLTYVGYWTWAEHHAAVQAADALAAESGRLADVIIDVSASGPLPDNAIQNLSQTLRAKYPHLSQRLIVVSQGRVAQFILEMVQRVNFFAVHDRQIHFVSTLAEAHALLAEFRHRT